MFEKWVLGALAALGIVTVMIFNWNFQKNFNERVVRDNLLRSSNHSSDTSTEYMLWNSEETPTGLIIVDPEWVWYVYKYTFLESIGLNSAKNLKELDSFFPGVIIAVNDGYFLRTSTLNDDGEWEYRFGHKVPFARTPFQPTRTFGFVADTTDVNNPPPSVRALEGMDPIIPESKVDFPVVISDTMNGKNITAFYPEWNNNPTVQNHFGGAKGRWVRYAVDGRPLISQEGTAHDKPAIAREVLRGIDALMRWNANPQSEYRSGGELRIPAEIITNFNSENVTFVGPMVIAIADNFTWLGNRAMSFWTLSNTQIVKTPRYYVYAVGWINTVTKAISDTPNSPGGDTWIPKYLYSLCDPYGRDMYGQNMGGVISGMTGHIPGRQPADQPKYPVIHNRPMVIAPDGTWIFQIFNSEDTAAIFGAYPDVEMAQLCN